MKPRRLLLWSIPLIGLTLLAGCRKSLDFERWQQIRIGESRRTIINSFGSPLISQDNRVSYTDPSNGVAVEMRFDPKTNQLTFTQWSDPKRGVRVMGNPPQ